MKVPSIIVTVGSAGFNDRNIKQLLDYNISYLRFNTGRCSIDWIIETIGKLKAIGFRDEQFLIDIGNQKARVYFAAGDVFSFSKGEKYTLSSNCNSDVILENLQFVRSFYPGDIIIFGDGEIEALVEKQENDTLHICALDSGVEEKGVGIRKKGAFLPFHFGVNQSQVDDVNQLLCTFRAGLILSFVENVENIRFAKKTFPCATSIIPKIETSEAITNLSEICKESETVFIGRGDLALSMGWYKIGYIQQEIIQTAKEFGCKVFLGTGTLNTLQWNPTPSSAEVVDITNSALQNIDCIVLTSETGGSTKPFQSIMQLAKVLTFLGDV